MKKKIVLALSYYSPYVSGLTNVARDIAEGLAKRGWKVVVVTNRHDDALPIREVVNGVHVVRCPVIFRFGKGVISPSFVATVVRNSRGAECVNIHAPMLEAGAVAAAISLTTKAPVVMTYHCDVILPNGLVNRIQVAAIDASTKLAAALATQVVVTTDDYAQSSRLARTLENHVAIPPGCHSREGGKPSFRQGNGFHIGFLGRIVEEKGVEYLVRGFSAIDDPDARLLIAGDFAKVAGGSVIDRVREAIGNDDRITLLGFLDDDKLNDFYASIDAFALTSINPLEAFGIVQVEAMMAGKPAISSDLPGVRQPVLLTGFGEIVRQRNADDVRRAVNSLKGREFDTKALAAKCVALFGNENALSSYEDVFHEAATAARESHR